MDSMKDYIKGKRISKQWNLKEAGEVKEKYNCKIGCAEN